MAFPPPNSSQWTSGLLGCLSDCESCCCGLCCPCVLVGRITNVVDQGSTSCCTGGTIFTCIQLLTGCGFLYTCGYRARLRQKFGLPSSPCSDCLVDCCCLSCSICQVYRELKNRNCDPILGYEGVKQQYDQPPVNQFMAR